MGEDDPSPKFQKHELLPLAEGVAGQDLQHSGGPSAAIEL